MRLKFLIIGPLLLLQIPSMYAQVTISKGEYDSLVVQGRQLMLAEARVEQYRKEIDELQQATFAYQTQLANLNREYELLQREKTLLQNELGQQRDESQPDAPSTVDCRKEITFLQLEKEKLLEEGQALLKNHEAVTAELNAAKLRIRGLTDAHDELKAQNREQTKRKSTRRQTTTSPENTADSQDYDSPPSTALTAARDSIQRQQGSLQLLELQLAALQPTADDDNGHERTLNEAKLLLEKDYNAYLVLAYQDRLKKIPAESTFGLMAADYLERLRAYEEKYRAVYELLEVIDRYESAENVIIVLTDFRKINPWLPAYPFLARQLEDIATNPSRSPRQRLKALH